MYFLETRPSEERLIDAAAAVRACYVPAHPRAGPLDFCVRAMSYRVSSTGAGTQLWLHGSNARAESMSARVDGFSPYFYLDVGPLDGDEHEARARAHACAASLNDWLVLLALLEADAGIGRATSEAIAGGAEAVLGVELMNAGAMKSVGVRAGYAATLARRYAKLTLYSPTLMRPVRTLLTLDRARWPVRESLHASISGVRAALRAANERAPDALASAPLSARAKRERAVREGTRAMLQEHRRKRGVPVNAVIAIDDEAEAEINTRMDAYAAEDAAEADAADEAELALDGSTRALLELVREPAQKRSCEDDRVEVVRASLRARGSALMLPSDALGDGDVCLFEADIDVCTRYTVDTGIRPEQWVRLEASATRERYAPSEEARVAGPGRYARGDVRETRAHREFVVARPDGVALVEDELLQDTVPPQVHLSFDIETETAANIRDTSARNERVLMVCFKSVDLLADRACARGQTVSFVLECPTPLAEDAVRDGLHLEFAFDGNEAAMLLAMRIFMAAIQADMITGYNIESFDVPFLMDRADVLEVGRLFRDMSRTFDRPWRLSATSFSSRGAGTHKSKCLHADGLFVYDLLPVMRRLNQHRDNGLGAVAAAVLNGTTKDEMPYNVINGKSRTPEGRRELLTYCVKDALLPLLIIARLELVSNVIEAARVVGAVVDTIVRRGQSAQQVPLLYRYGRAAKPLPLLVYTITEAERCELLASGKYGGATVLEPKRGLYTRAVGTEDFEGLYPSIMRTCNTCATTRLHGGTAQAQALGLDLERDVWTQVDDALPSSPGTRYESYVRDHVFRGILARILDDLTAWRKRVKRELAAMQRAANISSTLARLLAADDAPLAPKDAALLEAHAAAFGALLADVVPLATTAAEVRALLAAMPRGHRDACAERVRALANEQTVRASTLDGRQLSIKLISNSLYGMLGAGTSRLPDKPTAAAVTRTGRMMIEVLAERLPQRFTRAAGYPADLQILYGDTDSVFCYFDVDLELDVAGAIFAEIAVYGTSLFKAYFGDRPGNVIRLEFENIYMPLLLLDKKCYAAVAYELKNGHMERTMKGTRVLGVETGIKSKGIEAARRDTVPLVAQGMSRVLSTMLEPGPASSGARLDAVRRYVRNEMLVPLYSNTLSFYMLTQFKQLRASVAAYGTGARPVHVEVVARAIELYGEDSPLVPAVGSRVGYLLAEPPANAPGQRKTLCGEDPLVAWRTGARPHLKHYRGAIMSALGRLLAPILAADVRDDARAVTARMDAFIGVVEADAVRLREPSLLGTNAAVRRHVRCSACSAKLLVPPGEPAPSLCLVCLRRQAPRRAAIERERTRLWAVCRRCQGAVVTPLPDIESLESAVGCEQASCPVLYERLVNDRERALLALPAP